MLTQIQKIPAAAPEIERLGFSWHQEAQYDLNQLLDENGNLLRVQVRDLEHYCPPARVAQYAVQMGETVFPPIIVTRNNRLVDGNTRREARRMRKEKYSPAIIVDADFGKSPKTDANLIALAATLNQMGAERLTPGEIRTAATLLVEQGWKPEQIGRALGVKPSMVSQIRRELAAAAKFAKVGFTQGKKLPSPVIRAFGADLLTGLNDVPFKKLADLALEANLSVNEIKEIAETMKSTGSDVGMIADVEKKRGEMEERIREHALLGNGRPAPSAGLRRALGYVTKFEAVPTSLVERSPDAMQEHLKVIHLTVGILQKVAQLQQDLIDG